MRMIVAGLALAAMALAAPVFAQAAAPSPSSSPGASSDPAVCEAERVRLDQDMAQARARGQMLRRRQLADTLAALQLRCEGAAPQMDRAAKIQRLEQEIRALQQELDQANAQLRTLRRQAP